MNPNLPVGGSDFASGVLGEGAEADGRTVVDLGYAFASFGDHLRGTESIAPVRTESIDAHLFVLGLGRNLGGGFDGALRVPVGSIRVVPLGGVPTTVAGFGDLELTLGYDLGRHVPARRFKPSLRIAPTLTLPTGEVGVVEQSSDVAPNVLAVGTGSVGVGANLSWIQPVARQWATRAWIGARKPMTYSRADVRLGLLMTGGAGVVFRPGDRLQLGLDLQVEHRGRARERDHGILINSGGLFSTAELGVRVRATDRVWFHGRGLLPMYRDVEGEQIVSTWGLSLGAAVIFGGEDEHAHGDEHEGEHAHEDEHAHQDEHAGEDEGAVSAPAPGDVADLARGGASFVLGDAAVPGKLVVIDFWADWCAPCKVIESRLEQLARDRPDLAVRKVEVPGFDAKVAQEHLPGVAGLPVVWILDRQGQVVARLVQASPDDVVARVRELLGRAP